MTQQAPERIWAQPTEKEPVPAKNKKLAKWKRGKWKDHTSDNSNGDVEYLRADLAPSHEAFQQMLEALEICIERGSVYGHKAAVAALKAAEGE